MPGQYLTPDAPTGDLVCRCVSVPVELLHVVAGAVLSATHATRWEQHGDLTPQEAADLMLGVYQSLTDTEGECSTMALSRIGCLEWYFGDEPPAGCLICDGTEYDVDDYPELYAKLLDSGALDLWGESTIDRFKVPDMRWRVAAGSSFGGALGTLAQGATGGTKTHTLTTAEMPVHNHSVNIPGVVNVQSGVGATPNTLPGLAGTTGNRGSGTAHNNLQPYMGVGCAIRYAD